MKKIEVILTFFLMVLLGCAPPKLAEEKKSSTAEMMKDVFEMMGNVLPPKINILTAALEQLDYGENIVLLYYREDKIYDGWNLWLWADGSDGDAYGYSDNHGFHTINVGTSTVAYMKFNASGTSDNDCVTIPGELASTISNSGKLNFIVRKGNWESKDPGNDQSWTLSNNNKYFAVISGDSSVYKVDPNARPKILSAKMLSPLEMVLTLSCKYVIDTDIFKANFSITDGNTKIPISQVRARDDQVQGNMNNTISNAETIWILLSEKNPLDADKEWKISNFYFSPATGVTLDTTQICNITEVYRDAAKKINKTVLGADYSASATTFRVWAPLASNVNLLLYDNWDDARKDGRQEDRKIKEFILSDLEPNSIKTENNGIRNPMALDRTTGIWSATVPENLEGKYYTYEIVNGGKARRICDIYANAVAPSCVAAQIIDMKKNSPEFNYVNPFGNSGKELKNYTDAVIYEMHICDWSRVFVPDSNGKFQDITNALKNKGEFARYLKDLGITHVQILPMFNFSGEYAGIYENKEGSYNWGYKPYHYNVPEERYVNDPKDGRNAVLQMKEMIAAFHEAGIAVNMDVVYNHTRGTGIYSLFDMTVPNYYYRLTPSGDYSNGSGCGNETASNHPMFRKFMIDSLRHWMNDYHINGFRFDLMGLHEVSVMEEIYKELKQIDPNVMVYGEPWTGGMSPIKDSSSIQNTNFFQSSSNIAFFNCFYRDAIKGDTFKVEAKGFIQGQCDTAIVDLIKFGLMGKKGIINMYCRSINYVECHDNYTLFDKLVSSNNKGHNGGDTLFNMFNNNEDMKKTIIAQEKTAAALVILAQGIPFISGGQELLWTKNGDHNSFETFHAIPLQDPWIYNNYKSHEVYNTYKGLIKLRKAASNYFGKCSSTAVKTVGSNNGHIMYTTGADNNFCILFNVTDKDWSDYATTTWYNNYKYIIDISTGELNTFKNQQSPIPARSFLILTNNVF